MKLKTSFPTKLAFCVLLFLQHGRVYFWIILIELNVLLLCGWLIFFSNIFYMIYNKFEFILIACAYVKMLAFGKLSFIILYTVIMMQSADCLKQYKIIQYVGILFYEYIFYILMCVYDRGLTIFICRYIYVYTLYYTYMIYTI